MQRQMREWLCAVVANRDLRTHGEGLRFQHQVHVQIIGGEGERGALVVCHLDCRRWRFFSGGIGLLCVL